MTGPTSGPGDGPGEDDRVVRVGGSHPYDVLIAPAASSRVAEYLPPGTQRAYLLHAPPLVPAAKRVADQLGSNVEVHLAEVPDAEQAKSIDVAARCWDELGAAGFTRSDVVVGVGGGALTDLAGFVAACWLRGVPSVLVPTSLLGMVDAAVGGKTGVNTGAGKNLVGAFHPPHAVLCDLDILATLPPEEYVPGLAEVVKAGFIADPEILSILEEDLPGVRRPSHPRTAELIERAVAVKARVVAADLTESATAGVSREILNYGHTLGHAIERRERYRWRHGNAVSVGMVFAAALGRRSGMLDAATADRHRAVLDGLGLPLSYDCQAWPALLETMRVDKKTRGSVLRFVVLAGLAEPTVLNAPSESLLAAAYADVCAPGRGE